VSTQGCQNWAELIRNGFVIEENLDPVKDLIWLEFHQRYNNELNKALTMEGRDKKANSIGYHLWMGVVR
jgi:hypothetical protein